MQKRWQTTSITSSTKSEQSHEKQEESPWFTIYRAQKSQNKFLPNNWHEKHFSTMKYESDTQLQKIVLLLKDRMLDDNVGIWLCGKTGHGKTHILLSLFNNLSWYLWHRDGGLSDQIKFYNYTDLCGLLRQDPNNYDSFCKLRSPQFLFIDDIGTSKSTDFIQEKIYSIFNYRCENELPTFVSTNLSIKEINNEFTERMGSRIQESAAWIELKETRDYRSNLFKVNMKKYREVLK